MGRTQQRHGPGALRHRQVVRSGVEVRVERLEPQSLQSDPQSPMAVAGDDRMVRLGETNYVPAPIGRHLPRGNDEVPSVDPARPYTAGSDTNNVQAPGARGGTVGRDHPN